MKCLRSLVRRKSANDDAFSENTERLQTALDSAEEVETLPPTVVALGNEVAIKNLDSGKESVYALVLPSQADIREHTISVLAPLGTALLGHSVGDVIQYDAPGGTRTFLLQNILVQHEFCSHSA